MPNTGTSSDSGATVMGVFEIAPASDGSVYNEYVLTGRGRALFPVVVAEG